MLKYLSSFLKSLEQWEKYQPSSFWLCSIGLYIFFSAGFGALFPESPRQSHVVIEQVRGGGNKPESIKFDPAFHRHLEKHFSDWPGRMAFQKKQEEIYKMAMRKRREALRLRLKENFARTAKEQNAIDYFNGTGFYAKYQDIRTEPNIFDTRQSFLRKMHDDKLRNDFLNNLNRRNNYLKIESSN